MRHLPFLTRLTVACGVASVAALLLSALALTDIAQGRETDLSLEWSVLRWSAVVIVVFHVAAFTSLLRSGARTPQRPTD